MNMTPAADHMHDAIRQRQLHWTCVDPAPGSTVLVHCGTLIGDAGRPTL